MAVAATATRRALRCRLRLQTRSHRRRSGTGFKTTGLLYVRPYLVSCFLYAITYPLPVHHERNIIVVYHVTTRCREIQHRTMPVPSCSARMQIRQLSVRWMRDVCFSVDLASIPVISSPTVLWPNYMSTCLCSSCSMPHTLSRISLLRISLHSSPTHTSRTFMRLRCWDLFSAAYSSVCCSRSRM